MYWNTFQHVNTCASGLVLKRQNRILPFPGTLLLTHRESISLRVTNEYLHTIMILFRYSIWQSLIRVKKWHWFRQGVALTFLLAKRKGYQFHRKQTWSSENGGSVEKAEWLWEPYGIATGCMCSHAMWQSCEYALWLHFWVRAVSLYMTVVQKSLKKQIGIVTVTTLTSFFSDVVLKPRLWEKTMMKYLYFQS